MPNTKHITETARAYGLHRYLVSSFSLPTPLLEFLRTFAISLDRLFYVKSVSGIKYCLLLENRQFSKLQRFFQVNPIFLKNFKDVKFLDCCTCVMVSFKPKTISSI